MKESPVIEPGDLDIHDLDVHDMCHIDAIYTFPVVECSTKENQSANTI